MAVQVKVNVKEDYDPLDMNSYSLNKLPKRPLSKVGQFCQTWGLPIAAIIFVCCSYIFDSTIKRRKPSILIER